MRSEGYSTWSVCLCVCVCVWFCISRKGWTGGGSPAGCCAEKIVSVHWRAGSASAERVGQGEDHPQGAAQKR